VLGTGHFDPRAALWYFAFLFGAGIITPAFTALFFDYVYSPLLIRHKLAVRTTTHYITRPWQEIMWVSFVATVSAAFNQH
jgi:hypothetical protein